MDTDACSTSCDDDEFICGVIEGFYGRPWTTEQRKSLFEQLGELTLNTYMYAPKDDLKHRGYWRDLYTEEECRHLEILIKAATHAKVSFCYAISPGWDITYSKERDVETIVEKLKQVQNLGCTSFAVLFDDIEPAMNEIDRDVFNSFAHAQVSVANKVFEALDPTQFMFCPTEYSETRANPDLETSEYLSVIGQSLHPRIKILWTGPNVISLCLSDRHLKSVISALHGRKPVIWDNLLANDYDPRRLFLGPFCGRPSSLRRYVSGVMLNPNCEFESNYVAIYTLSEWKQRRNDQDDPYDPEQALERAVVSWLPIMRTPKSAFGSTVYSCSAIQKAETDEVQGQLDDNPAINAPSLQQQHVVNSVDNSDPGSTNNLVSLPVTTPLEDVPSEDVPLVRPISEILDDASSEVESTPSTKWGAVVDVDAPPHEADYNDAELVPTTDAPLLGCNVLDPTVLAVNSLTSTYDEPMELAPVTPAHSESTVEMASAHDSKLNDSDDKQPLRSEMPPSHSSSVMEIDNLLTEDDVRLLIDLFYLPFRNGTRGQWLLREAGAVMFEAYQPNRHSTCVDEWRRRVAAVYELCTQVFDLCCRLSGCANRGLVYDLYPYVWEASSIIMLLCAHLHWLQVVAFQQDGVSKFSISIENAEETGMYVNGVFDGIVTEPWTHRGGLLGDFQRLLPIGTIQDLFVVRPPFPPTDELFEVAPLCGNAVDVNAIMALLEPLALPAAVLQRAELLIQTQPANVFLAHRVRSDREVIAVCVSAVNLSSLDVSTVPAEVTDNYSSYIWFTVLPVWTDETTNLAKRLVSAMLSALKSLGATSVFSSVTAADLELYQRCGFQCVGGQQADGGTQNSVTYVGRGLS